MSDQLRDLVLPFGDVDPPLDLRARISVREALISDDHRAIRIPRFVVVAVGALGVVLVIGALALVAHTRSSAPAPAKPPPGPATQAELDGFLNSLKPRLAKLQSDIRAARSELSIYTANPTVYTASGEGQWMFHASVSIGEDDYSSLTAMTVPGALNPAWSQFTHRVKHAGAVVAAMDDDIRNNDIRAARRGTPRFINQTGQPIAQLKAALKRYAANAHLRLPAWVGTLGPGT